MPQCAYQGPLNVPIFQTGYQIPAGHVNGGFPGSQQFYSGIYRALETWGVDYSYQASFWPTSDDSFIYQKNPNIPGHFLRFVGTYNIMRLTPFGYYQWNVEELPYGYQNTAGGEFNYGSNLNIWRGYAAIFSQDPNTLNLAVAGWPLLEPGGYNVSPLLTLNMRTNRIGGNPTMYPVGPGLNMGNEIVSWLPGRPSFLVTGFDSVSGDNVMLPWNPQNYAAGNIPNWIDWLPGVGYGGFLRSIIPDFGTGINYGTYRVGGVVQYMSWVFNSDLETLGILTSGEVPEGWTFDNSALTGISATSLYNNGMKNSLFGWLTTGNVIATNGSCYYFISRDGKNYWNVCFVPQASGIPFNPVSGGAGDAYQLLGGPMIDSDGSFYFTMNGNAYTSNGFFIDPVDYPFNIKPLVLPCFSPCIQANISATGLDK